VATGSATVHVDRKLPGNFGNAGRSVNTIRAHANYLRAQQVNRDRGLCGSSEAIGSVPLGYVEIIPARISVWRYNRQREIT